MKLAKLQELIRTLSTQDAAVLIREFPDPVFFKDSGRRRAALRTYSSPCGHCGKDDCPSCKRAKYRKERRELGLD